MVAALCVPVAKKKVSHFALSVKIFLVKYGVKGHLLRKIENLRKIKEMGVGAWIKKQWEEAL